MFNPRIGSTHSTTRLGHYKACLILYNPLRFDSLGSFGSLRMPTSRLNWRNHCALSAAVWFQGSSLRNVSMSFSRPTTKDLLVIYDTSGLVLELLVGRDMAIGIVG